MLNLIATLAAGTVVSFIVFKLAVALYKKVRSPLLNPLLVTVAFIIAFLCIFHIPLDSFESSVQLISFLLGPATVALAYSVYRQRQILKQHFIPIFCGCLVGSIVSMISAYTLCELLGLGDEMATSFIPKSVTTPIAIAVSEQLGGITSITVAAVIITGILGAVGGRYVFDALRVRDPAIRGFAIGVASHGIGTARAFQVSEQSGAFAALAMGLNGALTALLLPFFASWLGGG